MQMLFSKMVEIDQEGSLSNLRQAYKQIVIDLNTAEDKRLAGDLIARAHLCSLIMDRRELYYAIKCFEHLRDWDSMENVLRLAKLYGQIRSVWQIKQIGHREDIGSLKVEDYADWFKSFGVKWFDMYIDAVCQQFNFINDDDIKFIEMIVEKYFVPNIFWTQVLEDCLEDKVMSRERKKLLYQLAIKQDIFVKKEAEIDVEQLFFEYCHQNKIVVLKRLQAGINNVRRCSYVYLAMDSDGIIKIFKELLDYNDNILGDIFDNEDKVYEHLRRTDFLPRHYGRIQITDDLAFIKQSIHFGQPLSDYVKPGNQLSVDQVCFIIRKIAEKLAWLHENDVLYLDLKPENVLFNGQDVQILDFGVSRILKDGQTEVDSYPFDARFVPPEVGTYFRASKQSDVFQLGVLFHMLIEAKHPFMIEKKLVEGDSYQQSAALKYVWPNIVLPYRHNLAEKLGDSRLEIIKKMVCKNPADRISLEKLIDMLNGPKKMTIWQKGRENKRSKKKNIILFPARMGIPHKGHIEYISRLLELGFFVKISIQRSYTITDRDPIPKWLVMKMVGQSLFDKGFTEEDFCFMLTPFYETHNELRMHFTMMPERENIVGVASGNPEVWQMFDEFQIYDQRSVFAFEGDHYDHKSWGEIIRNAVKDNNYRTFKQYAASGVERILTFDEIQQIYAWQQIDFVSGKTRVVLLDEETEEIISGRVMRFSTPEASLAIHCKMKKKEFEFIDAYAKYTVIQLDGKMCYIQYLRTEFDGENETIYYKLT